MFRAKTSEEQPEFWVETRKLPKVSASTFYHQLDQTLEKLGFSEKIREICRPTYADSSKGGRPGIDPAVYLKMLLIGFFENLPSERSIASRCEDSLSLRALQHRNTEEDYWDYVKKLAAGAGIDPNDTKAVRNFDRTRKGRKTSNAEWVNPNDPDAKIGMTKHGACDMIYKPEHITDLETGAIVAAEVRLGDQGDTEDLCHRVVQAGEALGRVFGDPLQQRVLRSLTADEGYFSVEEVAGLQAENIRAIIGDPHAHKRNEVKQDSITKRVLNTAKRAIKSKSGKALLKKRGEFIERSFCHVLDHGKHRRATLRGQENLRKRQLVAAFTHNLSLIMRHLTGFGTVKQWLAGNKVGEGRSFGPFWLNLGALRGLLSLIERIWNPRPMFA